jgi:signal transduction histidine kinase
MQPMRLVYLNGLALGTLLALALVSGAMTLVHANLSHHWEDRIALAQASYAEHLSLQANVTTLFKEHGDALLLGDTDSGTREAEIARALRANIARIRTIIAEEIEMVGGEEAEELEDLARIEDKVRALTGTLRSLTDDGRLLPPEDRRAQLIQLMDDEIDTRLAESIAAALEGERAEVDETLAEARAFGDLVHRLVFALSAVSVLASLAAAVLYHRQVTIPARALGDAVARYEGGDFAAVPAPRGVYELRRIAGVLGRMAALLRARHETQEDQRRALEAAVTARTTELTQVLSRAEIAERNRRRMMADVSHELRTPLTVILGEADVTLRNRNAGADTCREALGRIRDTAKHANAIVDDLLLIARQEAARLRLDLTDMDLNQLAARTAELVGRPVTLDLPAVPARLRADPIRIRQCILALLQNAIRYGGTSISVTVSRSDRGWRVAVTDDGPGMSDAEKAEAFERFFRGSNAGAPEVDGTGLGLPIVRAIAEAHGGHAGLSDHPGGGLCAWFDLPADRGLALVSSGAA